MVYWWGRYLYFNDKQIKISNIEMMNYAFGSSVSFELRAMSTCIEHNNYGGGKIKLISKPTPIPGPFHK